VSPRRIQVEIVETIRYQFDLEPDDVATIMEMDGGFTYDNVREWSINLYEDGGVDVVSEGYDVSVDHDFDVPDAIEAWMAGWEDL
jgi:hypothetical protein